MRQPLIKSQCFTLSIQHYPYEKKRIQNNLKDKRYPQLLVALVLFGYTDLGVILLLWYHSL